MATGYPTREILRILRDAVRDDETITGISQRLGISRGRVQRWFQHYGLKVLRDRLEESKEEIKHLREVITRLLDENIRLKQLLADALLEVDRLKQKGA